MFCRCVPPQCELLCSECTLLQRLEPEFPTSQGKCPSDLTTGTASPPLQLSHYPSRPTSSSTPRLALQHRGQGIQLGCGKSMFNSLLTWFKAWSWTEISQKVSAVITGAYRLSFPLLFVPKVMTWVIKGWWIRKMSKKHKKNKYLWGIWYKRQRESGRRNEMKETEE